MKTLRKEEKNSVLSQNETCHENFQTGIFSLAFLSAFEAFLWECFIFPLQLQLHNPTVLVHSHWLINLIVSPLMGPDSPVVSGVSLISPLRPGARAIRTPRYLHISRGCHTR